MGGLNKHITNLSPADRCIFVVVEAALVISNSQMSTQVVLIWGQKGQWILQVSKVNGQSRLVQFTSKSQGNTHTCILLYLQACLHKYII